jgi:hypothetical protein
MSKSKKVLQQQRLQEIHAKQLDRDTREQVAKAVAEGRLDPEMSKARYKRLTPDEREGYDGQRIDEIAGILRTNELIAGILKLEREAREARQDAAEMAAQF